MHTHGPFKVVSTTSDGALRPGASVVLDASDPSRLEPIAIYDGPNHEADARLASMAADMYAELLKIRSLVRGRRRRDDADLAAVAADVDRLERRALGMGA